MSDVRDYLNRRADVLAFQADYQAVPGREELLRQALAEPGNPGGIVAGVQKLAQRYLLALLLPRGTMRYLPNAGTDFIPDGRRGRWRTAADVEQSFYSANLDVRRQLRAEETATDPADERFADGKLLGVALSRDSVSIRVQVDSLAGTGYTFITPIRVVVR